ncbi:MAG TPA: GTP cyclohydrolase I FolE [Clostridium sp.]|nr:GTP cyclohydrolase I FolE [Clostridium sp.]
MKELKKKIDTETIQRCIREILVALGDDPEREGLKDTPKRVAKMYEEVFEGMNYTNREIAAMFNTTFEDEDSFTKDNKNLVVVRDIEIHSYCEHHMALMYNMKVNVVYRPNKKIIGLSKIARIADMVGKRLQLQERIGSDIAEILSIVTESEDIGVIISGEHSCMTARGIKKAGTKTYTTTFKGVFKEDNSLRHEALLLINN